MHQNGSHDSTVGIPPRQVFGQSLSYVARQVISLRLNPTNKAADLIVGLIVIAATSMPSIRTVSLLRLRLRYLSPALSISRRSETRQTGRPVMHQLLLGRSVRSLPARQNWPYVQWRHLRLTTPMRFCIAPVSSCLCTKTATLLQRPLYRPG